MIGCCVTPYDNKVLMLSISVIFHTTKNTVQYTGMVKRPVSSISYISQIAATFFKFMRILRDLDIILNQPTCAWCSSGFHYKSGDHIITADPNTFARIHMKMQLLAPSAYYCLLLHGVSCKSTLSVYEFSFPSSSVSICGLSMPTSSLRLDLL